MHAEIAGLPRRACDQVSRRVEAVGAGQWEPARRAPGGTWRTWWATSSPGTSWVAPLVGGLAIAEVGDRFDGDLLGDDPVGAWRSAAAAAIAACGVDGAMQRPLHLSSGEGPAADYIAERVLDLVMHAWDAARATGVDELLDADLLDVAAKALVDKALVDKALVDKADCWRHLRPRTGGRGRPRCRCPHVASGRVRA